MQFFHIYPYALFSNSPWGFWILFAVALIFLFRAFVYRYKNRVLLRTQKVLDHLLTQCGVVDSKGNILYFQNADGTKPDPGPQTVKDLPVELQHELKKVLPEVFDKKTRKTFEFESFSTRYKIDLIPLDRIDFGLPAVMWIVHDITELTEAYAEHLHIVNRLQNTLSSIGDAVVSTDYDGVIKLVNPSVANMLKKSESDLMGKNFDQIFSIRDGDGSSLVKKVILERKSCSFRSKLEINEEEILFVEGLASPIVEDQIIVGTVFYFRDTTELARQEQRLQMALKFAQTSDRAKSDFLAAVNYDFRSAVNNIIGYCDLCRINSPDLRDDPNIENIHQEADKLLLMFNDILDVAKNDGDPLQITFAPVDFKKLFREIQRIFASTSEKNGISLVLQVSPNIPFINSDYKALRQILVRLLSHVYSLADRETILLSIDWKENNLVIEIAINSQKIKIMQNSNLSIFKRFCEQLNGTLNAVQTKDRFAIVFTLLEPKVCGEVETAALPAIKEQKTKPKKNIVILVDDTEVNLKVLALMLKKINVESVSCTTAQAALEEINQYTPQAVFMDLWMPGIGGEEMAAILNQNPETASIPRILVTADTMLKKDFEGLFHYIINKPLMIHELQRVWNNIEQLNHGQK
ncbi:MAG: response regulator [Planctomycetia bacterium]|nr:response regulator [Planctomycetia bacterium]